MDAQRKQDVVLNVRSTVASYMMYWHKLCVEVSILISSGIIAVSTFGVDSSAMSLGNRWLLIGCFAVAAGAGTLLILYASNLVQELRRILVKVDRCDQLFQDGAYLPGESLYPKSWEVEDAVRMDVVPKWSIGIMILTLVGVALLLLPR